jgi:uncharacterized membrane protein
MSLPSLTYLVPVALLLAGGLMFFTPGLTRPDIWFGVTVDLGFPDSNDGRRILRSFRAMTLLACAAALLLVTVGLLVTIPLLVAAGSVVQVAGQTLAFLAAHHRTLAHAAQPSTVREAALTPRRSKLPGGPVLQAGPFLVVASAAVWMAMRWHELPARFPTHWDATGRPDAWATRSVTSVFGISVIGFVMCGLLLLLGAALLTGSRRVSAVGPRAHAEQRFRFITLAVLLAAEYFVAATFALVTALPSIRNPGALIAAVMFIALIFVVTTALVLARVGQGGSRLVAPDRSETPIGDRTADANWRWGLLYVNRGDPALFVEKRFGLGYTFNFGNPWAWVILAAFLVVPVAITWLIRLAAKG